MIRYFTFTVFFTAVSLAAPDFPAYGFKSTLPGSATWELKKTIDDPKHDMAIRGYANEAGARSITLIIGKNNTEEKELDAFSRRFTKQLSTKPDSKITSEKTGEVGGIPARTISAEVQMDAGTHYMLSIVTVQGDKLYIFTQDQIQEK